MASHYNDKIPMPAKYALPVFLANSIDQIAYQRWLSRKAQTHVRRDRKRGNELATGEEYRRAIHTAVINSNGLDAYTGEPLEWRRLGQYDNDDSADGRRTYKHGFAMLPTVDHVGDGLGPAEFRICSWRVNDAKHDLDMPSFLDVCKAVLKHNGFDVLDRVSLTPPGQDSRHEPVSLRASQSGGDNLCQ